MPTRTSNPVTSRRRWPSCLVRVWLVCWTVSLYLRVPSIWVEATDSRWLEHARIWSWDNTRACFNFVHVCAGGWPAVINRSHVPSCGVGDSFSHESRWPHPKHPLSVTLPTCTSPKETMLRPCLRDCHCWPLLCEEPLGLTLTTMLPCG